MMYEVILNVRKAGAIGIYGDRFRAVVEADDNVQAIHLACEKARAKGREVGPGSAPVIFRRRGDNWKPFAFDKEAG